MRKYFLRYNGNIIRYNDFNIARMNWYEMLKYGKVVRGKTIKDILKIEINELLENLKILFETLCSIFLLLIFPISFPISNYFIRKKSRDKIFKITGIKCWEKEYWQNTWDDIVKMKNKKNREG